MAIKIENKSTIKLNFDKLTHHINSVLDTVPPAHLRGISKIILVDRVEEPRLDPAQRAELPGLYHPKMPGSLPWLEMALLTLRTDTTWYKRLGRRLGFKANVTTTLLSLVAQHYYLTLSHGVKRSQIEPAIRAYVEKQVTVYAQSRKGIRAALLKPLRPVLERFGRWLQKRYREELKKQAPSGPSKKKSKR
jgi:hypothetical protein